LFFILLLPHHLVVPYVALSCYLITSSCCFNMLPYRIASLYYLVMLPLCCLVTLPPRCLFTLFRCFVTLLRCLLMLFCCFVTLPRCLVALLHYFATIAHCLVTLPCYLNVPFDPLLPPICCLATLLPHCLVFVGISFLPPLLQGGACSLEK
jgi:hypothetical protein